MTDFPGVQNTLHCLSLRVPGVTLLVDRSGSIVWAFGFGYPFQYRVFSFEFGYRFEFRIRVLVVAELSEGVPFPNGSNLR